LAVKHGMRTCKLPGVEKEIRTDKIL